MTSSRGGDFPQKIEDMETHNGQPLLLSGGEPRIRPPATETGGIP